MEMEQEARFLDFSSKISPPCNHRVKINQARAQVKDKGRNELCNGRLDSVSEFTLRVHKEAKDTSIGSKPYFEQNELEA